MKLRTKKLSEVEAGARILMRIDCNVPIVGGKVDKRSSWRLERVLHDIGRFQKKNATVILIGHRGRPAGVHNEQLSLEPIAQWFAGQCKQDIAFVHDILSKESVDIVKSLDHGSLVMLENVRFHKDELSNSLRFAKRLAQFGDFFVNNAFGVCHRKHASVAAITHVLSSFAGSLVVDEVKKLTPSWKRPFTIAIGGIKLETKMPTLLTLGAKADTVLLGGGPAIVLESVLSGRRLRIKGRDFSRKEKAWAKKMQKRLGKKLILPDDYICRRNGKQQTILADDLRERDEIIDIGKKAQEKFSEHIKASCSILFNGTMGSLERGAQKGTLAIAGAVKKQNQTVSIVGGGDTVGFLQKNSLLNEFHFVSTGGGAMLAYLAGRSMPGLKPLIHK